MNGHTNGRWWKMPSFSVEDLLRWFFLILPIGLMALAIWVDLHDIKKSLRDIPTKGWVMDLTEQNNDVHRELGYRLDSLEKTGHRQVTKVVDPDERKRWDWQKSTN